MRRTRWVLVGSVMMLVLSSCTMAQISMVLKSKGAALPWWCNPTEEVPVTEGPAAGTVNWYAGTHKAPLSWDQCITLSAQFDTAKAYAQQWPTAGAAEANGFVRVTNYIPGMGTHHLKGGITPQMLASPGFNRLNPILDSAGLDDKFDPSKPEVLQYDSNSTTGKLVGFDYYVRTSTGQPPAGFVGNNDWWHHHPWICYRTSDAAMISFNASDSSCTASQGVNVNMSNYYMLHVWVLDDMTFVPDVYAGMMPCISGGTAIHDPDHSCHKTRSMSAMSAGMDHTMVEGMDHSSMDHGG